MSACHVRGTSERRKSPDALWNLSLRNARIDSFVVQSFDAVVGGVTVYYDGCKTLTFIMFVATFALDVPCHVSH